MAAGFWRRKTLTSNLLNFAKKLTLCYILLVLRGLVNLYIPMHIDAHTHPHVYTYLEATKGLHLAENKQKITSQAKGLANTYIIYSLAGQIALGKVQTPLSSQLWAK